MKNFIFLTLLISSSLKAQIRMDDILNTDAANRMTISWRCSSEKYPGVGKLPDSANIDIKVRNNGKIKISPNIFQDRFGAKDILQAVGLKNKTVQSKSEASIDYSECMNDFYAQLKEKFAKNTKNCSSKKSNICDFNQSQFIGAIDEQLEGSAFAQTTKNGRKLPRHLLFSKSTVVDYSTFSKEMTNFCNGKEFDRNKILSAGFQKEAGNMAGTTSSHPSQECLDKYKNEFTKYGTELEKEYCDISSAICDFVKDEIRGKVSALDKLKGQRAEAISKQEEIYRQKLKPDWDKEFEEPFNKMIANGQSGKCHDFTSNLTNADKSKTASATTMTNLISKNMDQLFAKMDAQCQKQFIRQYIEENTFEKVIGDWSVKNHCEINRTPFCNETRKMGGDIEKNLERMLSLSYGEYGKDYFRDQILACEKDNLSGLNDLLGKLKDFDEKLTCAPLKEGESKVVATWKYPTGISGNYSLKKTSPNTTDAYVNMNFTSDTKSPVSGPQMEERVKECMKSITPFMKGPGGQSLNIIIVNPAEAEKLDPNLRPPVNEVVVGSIDRSNSKYYSHQLECPTITHEVLHLFGLCDEYKEEWQGVYFDVETGKTIMPVEGVEKAKEGKAKFVKSYNCRTVPEVDSVMKQQAEVFDRAVPKKMTCECTGSSCKEFMGSGKPELQKLYQNDGWNVVDQSTRSRFCKFNLKPSVTKAQYLQNPKQFKILSSEEGKISYNFKYASEDSEIKSQNMSCDCTKPNYSAKEEHIADCMQVVSSLKQKIEEDNFEDLSNCPPGTTSTDSQWGATSSTIKKFDGKSFEIVKKREKPVMESILWPSQFDRIVGGACPEAAELFTQCSKLAYKTAIDEKSCNVPDECKDTKKVMGMQQ